MLHLSIPYRKIGSLLAFTALILLLISITNCGDEDDDIVVSKVPETAPAKIGLLMAPGASIEEITSARLIVTGDDMKKIEVELTIDKELDRASGSANVPVGNSRRFKVEVYVQNNLRYVGEQVVDVHSYLSLQIPVNIKPAEGVGVIGISDQVQGDGIVIAVGDSNIFLSQETGNRKLINNLSGSLASPARLKLDLSHGTAFDQRILQQLEDSLRQGGFQVTRSESSDYSRSSYESILIPLPTRSFSTSEISAITQFVNAGGMLILLADYNADLEPINQLANSFGFNFEYSIVSTPDGKPESFFLNNFSTNPLFDGIQQIAASYARSLTITPGSGGGQVYTAATPGPNATSAPDNPELSVTPTHLDFGADKIEDSFNVRNTGTGILDWEASADANWVSVNPSSGTTTKEATVNVTIDRSKLPTQTTSATITVNAQKGTQNATVKVYAFTPVLSVTPRSLDFGESSQTRQFSIENTGTGTLNWNIQDNLPRWLNASRMSGNTTSDNSTSITLTVNRSGLNSGTYNHNVSVSSNGGNGNVAVRMTVPEVVPPPLLSLSPTSINFGTVNTTGSFTVRNDGGETLNWNITSNLPAWLNVTPMDGQTNAGSSASVSLTISRQGLNPSEYRHTVAVTSNGGNGNVTVRMTVPVVEEPPVISPTSINFGTANTTGSFTVGNEGGGTLSWNITSDLPAWLMAAPMSGNTVSGSSSSVSLTVSRQGLNPGIYEHTISVRSNYGDGSVAVTMEVPEPDPELQLSPKTLNLDIATTTGSVKVTNSGGGTLVWKITADLPGWLTASRMSGNTASGKTTTVTLTANMDGLDPGSYKHTVSVTSDYGNASVAVTLTVPEPDPLLSVSPDSIDFGATDLTANLTVANVGGGTLRWNASKQESWLLLIPVSGSLSSGKKINIVTSVSRIGMASGVYEDTISITSNGGNEDISVSMEVPQPPPKLSLSPVSLDLGKTDTQGTINITNIGGGTLTWNIKSDLPSWLKASVMKGDTASGQTDSVSLTVNRQGLSLGTYTHEVSVTSNGGNGSVSVAMTVSETIQDFYQVEVGETFTITLSANQSAGYEWIEEFDSTMLQLISEKFVPTTGAIGAPSNQVFEFRALREGTTRITMTYKRPWEDQVIDTQIITVQILPASNVPILSLSQTSVDFSTNKTRDTFTITNDGRNTLEWKITPDLPNWLTASRSATAPGFTSGTIPAGGQTEIFLNVNRGNLKPGTYNHDVSVTSNGGNGTVAVTMIVPQPTPTLALKPAEFVFGTTTISGTLTIRNNGTGTLEWDIASDLPSWLRVTPMSGDNASGVESSVSLTVNRGNLNPGTYNHNISVTSNGGNDTVPVSMTVPEPNPVLAVLPASIDFGTTGTQDSFDITNDGGGTLIWNMPTNLPTWITASPMKGETTTGQTSTVSLNVNRSGLNPATYKRDITITSNGGSGTVSVTMTVLPPAPVLSLAPALLEYGETSMQKSFTISNKGGQILSWSITADLPSWLTASAMSGTSTTSNPSSVTLTVDRDGLDPGDYEHTVSVTSNGGDGSVSVTMTVPEPDPLLAVSTTSVSFGTTATQRSFNIRNDGGRTLRWSITPDIPAWLTVNPMDGNTNSGDSTSVTLNVNREGLNPGSYRHNLSITSQFGNARVRVSMTVLEPNPSLAVSPATIDFGITATQNTFNVANDGGGTLSWSITADLPSWLTADPMNGDTVSGTPATVTLNVNRNGLDVGDYEHTISVTSDYGNANVAVTMIVPEPNPLLAVEPTTLDFGSAGTEDSFTVTNDGGGTLIWSITANLPTWLTATPMRGETASGDSVSVTLTVDRQNLNVGTHTHTLSITSNGGNGSVVVRVTVESSPVLSYSPTSLDFGIIGTDITSKTEVIGILNSGGGVLSWRVRSNLPSWLTASPMRGENTANEGSRISVTADRTDLDPGTYNHTITITSNGGTARIRVTMTVQAPVLVVEPPELDLGRDTSSGSFTVMNDGTATLVWNITSNLPAWLTAKPMNGQTSAQSSLRVTVNVNRSALDPGDYSHDLSITSNGGNATVTVMLNVPNLPEISVSPASFNFGTDVVDGLLNVGNVGGEDLEWNVSGELPGWLTMPTSSGAIPPGESMNVPLAVSREGLDPATYTYNISITSNGGNVTVPVTMIVPPPKLSVTPASLDYGTSETVGVLTVTNTGGGSLSWQVNNKSLPTWIVSITPISGSLTLGQIAEVSVVVTRKGLDTATYTYDLPFESNGGNVTVPLSMTVPDPILALNPASLDFGDSLSKLSFDVTNAGGGILSWQITSRQPSWLSLFPTSGSLQAEDSAAVSVTVNRANLNVGQYNHDITLTSNGGSGTVSVTMEVPPPRLDASPNSLNFGTTTRSRTFTLTNEGGGQLVWSINSRQPFWITNVTPNDGSLTFRQSVDVLVTVSRDDLDPAVYNHVIVIDSNGGSENITITMAVPGPELYVEPTSLNFSTSTNTMLLPFDITNKGGGTLEWDLYVPERWAGVSLVQNPEIFEPKLAGSTEAGKTTRIWVRVYWIWDSAFGTHTQTIPISSNGGSEDLVITLTGLILIPDIPDIRD